MLSIREQLAKGIFPTVIKETKIPKKSKFLGTITDDGYCDYDVPEDSWYIEKDMTKANRLMRSIRARNQRRELQKLQGNKH